MDTIAVSQSVKVTIKGQEFELTMDEAKALATALGIIVSPPKPQIPYQPPGPARPNPPWDSWPHHIPDRDEPRRRPRDNDRIIMKAQLNG